MQQQRPQVLVVARSMEGRRRQSYGSSYWRLVQPPQRRQPPQPQQRYSLCTTATTTTTIRWRRTRMMMMMNNNISPPPPAQPVWLFSSSNRRYCSSHRKSLLWLLSTTNYYSSFRSSRTTTTTSATVVAAAMMTMMMLMPTDHPENAATPTTFADKRTTATSAATTTTTMNTNNINCTLLATSAAATAAVSSTGRSNVVVVEPVVRVKRHATIQEKMLQTATTLVKLQERYHVDWEHPLGHGSFGSVYTGIHKNTGEYVAIKEMNKSCTDTTAFTREMEALLRLRSSGGHPNICSLREHYEEGNNYYLVLDLIAGTEMFEALISQGAYSEADAARLVQETASALDYIHAIHIVHGDLKPENLMLSSPHASDSIIKVVDFGCAQVSYDDNDDDDDDENDYNDDVKKNDNGGDSGIEKDRRHQDMYSYSNNCGVARTPAYCPPEILRARQSPPDKQQVPHGYRIEPSFDMWALGVILYVMLTGVHPFDVLGNKTDEDIEQSVLNHEMPPLRNSSLTAHLSSDAIALIEQLLQWDPQNRLTAHQVLENPWVRGETARAEKIANSDKRLSKYRAFQSKLNAKVFADMVSLAPSSCNSDGNGRRSRQRGNVDNRTSLIEQAFRTLDRGHKGYVTTKDIQKLTQKQQQQEHTEGTTSNATATTSTPSSSIGESSSGGGGDDEQLSLSGFAEIMSETMKNRYFPKGHIIYHEGDLGESMFFLNSGSIEIYASDGFSKTLNTPGDYFGEGALMDPKRIRSASIRCVTPVHAIEISREYFEKYLAEDSALKVNFREVNNTRKRQRANALLQLQKSLDAKTVQRGEYIFRENEPGDELYILEEGLVDTTVDGHKVFSVGRRGDIFGEYSLVFQRPRNSSAQCVSSHCKLHYLRYQQLNDILESHPSMKESIRNTCLRREFQKAVCVKSRKPFPENETDLRNAFDAVDIDQSGKLEFRNIRNLIERLDSQISEGEIREILHALDLDESGAVSWDEFKVIFGMDTGTSATENP